MATNKQQTTTSLITGPYPLPNARMTQNFHLVWLDTSIDETNDECRNSIAKLREVVHTVNTFTDVDRCIDFITDTKDTAFMVISGVYSQILIPIILDIVQVSYVYTFCKKNSQYEKYLEECPKISGVYTDITLICEALKQATQDCDHNALSISFVKDADRAANQSLDTLDSSFMYTQMLKEILLTLDFNQGHMKEFFKYCREQFVGNFTELKNVEKIEKEYHCHEPIWWYTYQCFLYFMLNKALRTMEADLVVDMGFFVRDLHNNIKTLHSQQYGGRNHSNSFIVYRGQGMSQTDFEQLKTTQGGLLAFNSFLSTSLNQDVSLRFARRTISTSNLIGLLFVMRIDPSITTTFFADVRSVSYYRGEDEMLFSMHSVFRIEQMEQIEKNDRLWQVNLTLTSDNDPQLQVLTKSMTNDVKGSTGWFRLGSLMMQVAQFDKAQQLYDIMLDQTPDERGKTTIYQQLGWIKSRQGKNTEALSYCEKALKIFQKTLPENHPLLATSYNSIGSVYRSMGEYSQALSYYEKALEIRQETIPANDPRLATSYSNIGGVYDNMGEYSKALSYHEKALEIRQKTLPANHPDLGASYNNIGGVYDNMGEYWKALSYYKKAVEIKQKTLPGNHPDLAISYSNIGGAYGNIGEYSKALSHYEKAVEILQKTLPTNHPHLATSYSNIGLMYDKMGEYSKALSYYEKAVEILQKTLPTNHPLLATSYNNIGSVYHNMGECSEALSYYEKALEIFQKTLPGNHSSLATSYNNIGGVYGRMGEYSKALSYYKKALEILQKTLPTDQPTLASSYNNIGFAYHNMGEYSKALSYHEKALEIFQKTLPGNHPSLATSYNNIGGVYDNMGEYSKALSYFKCALDIWQRSLPPNHSHLKAVKRNIEFVKEKL